MADHVYNGCYYCETSWDDLGGGGISCEQCTKASCSDCSESLYVVDEKACILCKVHNAGTSPYPEYVSDEVAELEGIRRGIGKMSRDHIDVRLKKERLLQFAKEMKEDDDDFQYAKKMKEDDDLYIPDE